MDMGLFSKVIGVKKEENPNQQKMDDFWRETKYGYAPKDLIKVHFMHEREEYPKYPRSGDEGFSIAASRIIEMHNKLSYLESKTYDYMELIRGKCVNCNKYFIIPKSKKPIFFKCPFCSTEDEKKLIEMLFFQNPDNEIFGRCPGCQSYAYIKVNDESRYVNFYCKSCNNNLILNKDHPIDLNDYSENNLLNWCSACGHLFETLKENTHPIKCPRCESKLEPKK
jgi:DNA-directed RNA polymerase subunit RPC12/RpoP